MANFLPANAQQNYLPNDILIPERWEDANVILTDYFRSMVEALNDKEIGQYSTVQALTGQQWFDPTDATREVNTFRKVINFGTLPNTGTTSIAHGITTTANTIFTRIFGTATDPGAGTITQAIPIPYIDPNALANGIEINVDATNVNITTAADYTAYTTCYVVLEWIQN